MGENAYKIELPAEYEVSETLKVSDLFPYYGEESTLIIQVQLIMVLHYMIIYLKDNRKTSNIKQILNKS